jgi:PhnB protein
MATVNIYLNFNGNCEEAFLFYKSVFNGEIPYVGRFKDMPQKDDAPAYLKEMEDKIMHISLPVSKETTIMGCDMGGEWAPDYIQGNNFSLMVNADSREECERLFHGLSEGGKMTMPLKMVFWGDYFGMLTDKFGVSWMVCYTPPAAANQQE